jgi:predicted nucleotidyltransferase
VELIDVLTIIAAHEDELRHRHVATLSVFGSVARGEARPNSDVDLLVEFDQTATFDLYLELKEYLEQILDHQVDLVTSKAVLPRLRPYIERDLRRVA